MAKETAKRTGPRLRKSVDSAEKKQIKDKSPKRSLNLPKPVSSSASGLKKVLSLIVPRYFVNSWREVRQVAWPARKETWRLTLAVFIFAAIFGALVSGVDKGLDEIFKKLVLR